MDHDTIINALTDKVKQQEQTLNAVAIRLKRLHDELYQAKVSLYNSKSPLVRDETREHVKEIDRIREEMAKTLAQYFNLIDE